MHFCDNSGTCSGANHQTTVVAFLTKLSPNVSCSGTCPGGQQLYLAPINIASLENDVSVSQAVQAMNNTSGSSTALAAAADSFVPNSLPQSSVNICFASGTNNDSGLITIGNGDGQLAVNLKIFTGDNSC